MTRQISAEHVRRLAGLDGDRPVERSRVHDLHGGVRNEPPLAKIAEHLGIALADLTDDPGRTRLQIRERLVSRARHLAVLGGNRLAVGIARRPPQHLEDLVFELLRDNVLQPAGLFVYLIPCVAQGLFEVQFKKSVVAQNFERHLLAGSGQHHALVGVVSHELEGSEFLDHASG